MHKLSRWFDMLPLLGALALGLAAPALCQSRPDVIWQKPGFLDGPAAAAYSPDGSMLAVTGSMAVKLFRTSDGAFLRTLRANDWMATAVWSSSGAHIIGLGQSGLLMRWRVSDGALLQTITTAQAWTWGPRTAALSPDGASVVTCSLYDPTVCVWRVSDFALDRTIALASVSSVSWSPGGLIACGRADKSIALVNAATGSVVGTLSGHTGEVRTVSFSPDGARLVSGSADHTARIWDVTSRTQLQSLTASTTNVRDAVFSPDGANVATGAGDGTLTVWNASTGVASASINTYALLNPVAFSPDGQTLCSGWQLNRTGEFSAADLSLKRELTPHSRRVHAIAASHDGLTVASAGGENTICLWNAADGAKLQVLYPAVGVLTGSLGFSADDTEVFAIGYDGGITRWSVADGSQTGWFAGFPSQSAALSPDASLAVMGGAAGRIGLYNTTTGDNVWEVTSGGGELVNGLQFSPDGLSIAFYVDSGMTYVLSALTGAVTASRPAWGTVRFSPDSATLVSAGNNAITLWDIAAGTTRTVSFPGPAGTGLPLAFSPDGAFLAVSAGNRFVDIVRVADGVTRALYTEESSMTATVGCFSPDGKALYYGTEDSSVVAMVAPDTTADTAVTTGSWTVAVGDPVTLSATLTSGGAPVAGQWLHFWLAGAWQERWYAGSAVTDAAGVASLTIIAPDAPYWQVSAAFAGGGGYGYSSTGLGSLFVNKVATRTYVTDRTGAIDNMVILRGYLFAPGLRNLRGKALEFNIAGTAVGSAITNLAGRASLPYVLPAALGSGVTTIGASFAGDASYGASSGTATLTVSKAPVYIWVLSRSAARGSRTTLRSYVRSLPLYPWLPGLAIDFALDGTSVGSSNTDASGRASVLYTVPAGLAIGDHALECAFAGNGSYLSASGSGVLTVTP